MVKAAAPSRKAVAANRAKHYPGHELAFRFSSHAESGRDASGEDADNWMIGEAVDEGEEDEQPRGKRKRPPKKPRQAAMCSRLLYAVHCLAKTPPEVIAQADVGVHPDSLTSLAYRVMQACAAIRAVKEFTSWKQYIGIWIHIENFILKARVQPCPTPHRPSPAAVAHAPAPQTAPPLVCVVARLRVQPTRARVQRAHPRRVFSGACRHPRHSNASPPP